jgi:hypothetical protein
VNAFPGNAVSEQALRKLTYLLLVLLLFGVSSGLIGGL